MCSALDVCPRLGKVDYTSTASRKQSCVKESTTFFSSKVLNASIHFPYPLNPVHSHRWAVVYPSCHWARGKVKPGQAANPSEGQNIDKFD